MYFLDKKINKIELSNILGTRVDIYSDKEKEPEAAVCGCSANYVFLKNLQCSLENTCVEVSF